MADEFELRQVNLNVLAIASERKHEEGDTQSAGWALKQEKQVIGGSRKWVVPNSPHVKLYL